MDVGSRKRKRVRPVQSCRTLCFGHRGQTRPAEGVFFIHSRRKNTGRKEAAQRNLNSARAPTLGDTAVDVTAITYGQKLVVVLMWCLNGGREER